jgi:hypothetical protein
MGREEGRIGQRLEVGAAERSLRVGLRETIEGFLPGVARQGFSAQPDGIARQRLRGGGSLAHRTIVPLGGREPSPIDDENQPTRRPTARIWMPGQRA